VRLTAMGFGTSATLLETLRALVGRGLELHRAIAHVSAHPARVLGLDRPETGLKGTIAVGGDADLLVLDAALTPWAVLARGRCLMRDGAVIGAGARDGNRDRACVSRGCARVDRAELFGAVAVRGRRSGRPFLRSLTIAVGWLYSRLPRGGASEPSPFRGLDMRTGHVLTLLGALVYLVGALVLPWQHFTLADVQAMSFDVSALGQMAIALAVLVLGASVFGLVSGQRALTARFNLGMVVLLMTWLVYAKANNSHGFVLMDYEEIGMQSGYLLGIWGVVLALTGTLLVLATLPTWDESSSSLRVLTLYKNRIVGDRIIYTPQILSVAQAHGNEVPDPALRQILPHFRVTPEGDCSVGFAPTAAGKPGKVTINHQSKTVSEIAARGFKRKGIAFSPFAFGDRGTVDLGDTQVTFHFVAPVPGHAAAPLLDRTEIAAFSMAAAVALMAIALYPILTWRETAKPPTWCGAEDKKWAGVVAKAQEDEKIEIANIPEPEAEEPIDEEVSKKAGGEEGKFGDPNIDPKVVSKVPLMDGKMVERIDPRQVGLTKLLTENLGQMDAVAEVLKGDMGAMTSKLAVAMGGEGSEFVLGHGSGGMGFTGDGTGGGGDGAGRIMGMGDIDTGGGHGVKAGLGDKGKKRVGNLTLSGSTSQGFCKKGNIESVVRRRAGAIRACYEQRLQVNKDLKGKISIRWTIDAEGSVSAASATVDTMGDAESTNCVLRTLRRMKFEKPEGGVCVVQWPFVFSPG